MEQMMAEVDYDGSGEVEYPEFVEIMTSSLAKLQESKRQGTQGRTDNTPRQHKPHRVVPADVGALRHPPL